MVTELETTVKKTALLFSTVILIASGCLGAKVRSPVLTVWATGDSLKIKPDEAFQAKNHHWDNASSTLRLKGAANEWVAAQLILSSPRDLSPVRITCGELRSDSRSIGRENIHFFREHYIPVTRSTDRNGSTGPGEYPDPLIPFHNPYSREQEELALPLSLEGKRNCPAWMDIFIPPGTPAGVYRGEIRIGLGEKPVKKVELELTVWAFSLPARKNLKVFFDLYSYRWTKGEGRPFSLSEETWEVLKHYEIMAHDHGFSNGHWGLMPANINATEGVDWTHYDKYLGQVLDGSLFADGVPPAGWELPFPESWDPGQAVLENYCREVVRHWEEKGWELDSAFAYVWDERGPLNERVKQYGEILKEASGGRINYFYTTGPHPNLYGVVDWWCPRASQYNPVLVQDRQKKGEKGLFYHAGEPSVGLMCLDAIGLAFRTWGWIAWKYRCDGFFDWASNFWGESPYTDPLSFGTDNGNMYLFYPGNKLPQINLPAIKGPVPSFRIKMVRRGIQDYEYFYLARKLGLEPDTVVNAVVQRGLGETGSYGIDPRAWSRDPEEWYRARDRIGEMIHSEMKKDEEES